MSSNYEYHQLLEYLYFNNYADSYENVEYLIQQLINKSIYYQKKILIKLEEWTGSKLKVNSLSLLILKEEST